MHKTFILISSLLLSCCVSRNTGYHIEASSPDPVSIDLHFDQKRIGSQGNRLDFRTISQMRVRPVNKNLSHCYLLGPDGHPHHTSLFMYNKGDNEARVRIHSPLDSRGPFRMILCSANDEQSINFTLDTYLHSSTQMHIGLPIPNAGFSAAMNGGHSGPLRLSKSSKKISDTYNDETLAVAKSLANYRQLRHEPLKLLNEKIYLDSDPLVWDEISLFLSSKHYDYSEKALRILCKEIPYPSSMHTALFTQKNMPADLISLYYNKTRQPLNYSVLKHAGFQTPLFRTEVLQWGSQTASHIYFKLIVLMMSALTLYIRTNHLIIHHTNRRNKIPTSPQVLTPIALLQRFILILKTARGLTL